MEYNGWMTDSALNAAAGRELLACHECDFLHRLSSLPDGAVARCVCCGAVLAKGEGGGVDRTLAYTLTALILFFIANSYPILGLKAVGQQQHYTLLSGAMALGRFDLWEVGFVVFLTSILFPFLHLLSLLYVLIPLRSGYRPRYFVPAFKFSLALMPWGMVGVYMLGVLVSIVKLGARKAGLVACHVCHLVLEQKIYPDHSPCPRCRSSIHSRKTDSLTRTWALVLTAIIFYIPANIYPVMTVSKLGQGEPNTILSGVVALIEAGMWPLALIVFIASIIVPVGKLLILIYLLLSVKYRSVRRLGERATMYRILELFGHWSMVDVFLVSILVALVDMGFLATIEPGVGVLYFGVVVIITMFASRAFDPRLIWDVIDDDLG